MPKFKRFKSKKSVSRFKPTKRGDRKSRETNAKKRRPEEIPRADFRSDGEAAAKERDAGVDIGDGEEIDDVDGGRTAVEELLQLVGCPTLQSSCVESDSDDGLAPGDSVNTNPESSIKAATLDANVLRSFNLREEAAGKNGVAGKTVEDPCSEEEDEDDENAGLLIDPCQQNISSVKGDCLSYFGRHFQTVLPTDIADSMLSDIRWNSERLEWPELGQFNFQTRKLASVQTAEHRLLDDEAEYEPDDRLSRRCGSCFAEYGILPRVSENLRALNLRLFSTPVTQLQSEVLSVVGEYRDLYLPHQTLVNSDQLRVVYMAHVLCHVLRTRARILANNARVSRRDRSLGECRDQGLTRARVLILLPFRQVALCVVNMLIWLLQPEARADVFNYRRFVDEFGDADEQEVRHSSSRPDDFCRTFVGNTDDSFRLGIRLTKKSVRLYSEFYQSDIIVASPLGLRPLIGAEGEAQRDFDYLNSIELVIVDRSDIYMMQNWEHVLHVFDHLHRQPQSGHGVDFGRVRQWTLNGWQKLYRQTLVFSSLASGEVNALTSTHCHNYNGRVIVYNPPQSGTIQNVMVPSVPQRFHRFSAQSPVDEPQQRFDFFMKKILPHYRISGLSHVMIYVPSYFDYVRLRNHFIQDTVNFTQICEYSKEGRVSRARDMFFHSKRTFLLYTERFHFYHRYRIKGVRHVIFYALPTYGHFYPELCNLMQEVYQNPRADRVLGSVCAIFSRFDQLRLARVLGSSRAASIISASKDVHMYVTGES